MDDIRFWLALLHVRGIGPLHYHGLLSRYGNPRRIFAQAATDPTVRSLLSAATRHDLSKPDWEAVARDLAWLDEPGHHVLTLCDPRYPILLKQIPDPPPVLYITGDPGKLMAPQLAIVGSRHPTPAGSETAHDFAVELTRSGLTITSGLAIGIDAAAHRGALAASGSTIAVLATGPDRVYPPGHRDLAAEINDRGALISEFPPGHPPYPGSFPRRNRIISGLSSGTLVVEAALRSGSLITARAALEQGREVFAIPGSIHNPCARGCHALIRDGAKLVESIHDILEELGNMVGTALQPSAAGDLLTVSLEETAAKLLKQIDFAPTTVDTLIERTGYPAERLHPLLLDLELSNHISSAPGGAYVRRAAKDSS